MSTLLSAQSLSYDLPSGPLLEGISFTLKKGDRIGLIGHNGSGKSTLMRLLWGDITAKAGTIARAHQCILAWVEQYLPVSLSHLSLIDAVLEPLPDSQRLPERWRAELLLSDMGFSEQDWALSTDTLSGGQYTRLLLARALMTEPDLLLLDEPGNHLDLPTLLWLENFLKQWRGSFVMVSHDQHLLDNTTNCTWILRDKTLAYFQLPCSKARIALQEKEAADAHRHQAEQREIDRLQSSAKQLAQWGQVYDNESFARKAKSMTKRVDRLKDDQTCLTQGTPWQLKLTGEAMKANRLLAMEALSVRPAKGQPVLFQVLEKQIKSGDHIALVGRNGCGKSSLLRYLWQRWNDDAGPLDVNYHPQIRLGYYDQNQQQLNDNDTLMDALRHFAPMPDEERKMALIHAGFAFHRHTQAVKTLSGGERSRLLFIGLTLAQYHLLFLDEPTNHLDLEGKEELADTLSQFAGGLLLVSHDRELIEKSCHRFWLIDDNTLHEFSDTDELYTAMGYFKPSDEPDNTVTVSEASTQKDAIESSEEQSLSRLIALEALLEQDRARKTRHQKPKQQQSWLAEIAQINVQLGLAE